MSAQDDLASELLREHFGEMTTLTRKMERVETLLEMLVKGNVLSRLDRAEEQIKRAMWAVGILFAIVIPLAGLGIRVLVSGSP